jgi:hypothetical protein
MRGFVIDDLVSLGVITLRGYNLTCVPMDTSDQDGDKIVRKYDILAEYFLRLNGFNPNKDNIFTSAEMEFLEGLYALIDAVPSRLDCLM